MTQQSGTQLELKGWRQGSVVQKRDNETLLNGTQYACETEQLILIIASQSCDIANNQLEDDPFIELSIARFIEKSNGNYTFNKNPRILHTDLSVNTDGVNTPRSIALKAFEKLPINKQLFETIEPDKKMRLTNKTLESYVLWLAARYRRPALPSEFNRRLSEHDPKGKLRKLAKKSDNSLSGIYIKITPDSEVSQDQTYVVRLLGLVPADFVGDINTVNETINNYADIMNKPTMNMDVKALVRREDQISVAVLKDYKRFYYDDLSIKNNSVKPLEIDH